MDNYNKWINSTPPDILYHYTSTDSFYKICESVGFRATHIEYLNDSSEFIHGQDIFIEELENLDLYKINTQVKHDIDRLINQHKDFKDNQGISSILSNQHAFVISFTTKDDDLSQWRAYCPAGGIMMGLSVSKLKHVTDNNHINKDFKLFKCIYEDEEKRELIKELIEWYINQTPPIPSIATLLNNLTRLSCAFKNSAFADESEWRMVYANIQWEDKPEKQASIRPSRNIETLKFYVRDNMLIPYIEFQLNPQLLDKHKYEELNTLRKNASDNEGLAMQKQEQSAEAAQEYFDKFYEYLEKYNSLYDLIGDKTRLPKPLDKITIGPGEYTQNLLQSAIRNYIHTKIDVLNSYPRYRVGYDEQKHAKEAYWELCANHIEISKIPYRKKL